MRSLAALLACRAHAVPLDTVFETDYRKFVLRRSSNDSAAAAAAERAEAAASRYARLELHWSAPLLSGGGYCSEATALLMGLAAHPGVVTSATAHGDSVNSAYLRGLPPLEYATVNAFLTRGVLPWRAISVCHSEPGAWHVSDDLPQRYSTSVCPLRGAAYRVGRTMFETDRTPDGWAQRLNAMDEVWVPTNFTAEVFAAAGVPRDKMLIFPEAVDTRFFDPAPFESSPPVSGFIPLRSDCDGGHRALRPSRACPYRFLSVGKWERRKNFEGLLRAYLTEFAPAAPPHAAPPPPPSSESDDPASALDVDVCLPEDGDGSGGDHVELYILTSAYHSSADFDAQVQALVDGPLRCAPRGGTAAAAPAAAPSARDDTNCIPAEHGTLPPVRLLTDVRQLSMPALYASVDAFVLPSRGEGWGRPHAEAMAMALPVIATAWSGPSEFMNDGNAYPLRHSRMEAVPDGPFAGHMQAEPDVVHLRQLMRHVYEHPADAAAKGRVARADMLRWYSPSALADFTVEQVKRITTYTQSKAESATEL